MRAKREFMVGLILSEVILYLAAGVIGFALGWRGYAWATEERRRADQRDLENVRAALSDAQVRRARQP